MAPGLGRARGCLGKQAEGSDKADPPHAPLTVSGRAFHHLLRENDSPYTYLYTWPVITLTFSCQNRFFCSKQLGFKEG